MKKSDTLCPSTSAAIGSTVNVYGSGPLPLKLRDAASTPSLAPRRQASQVRLLPNTRKETVDSLLQYVSAFGQGTGSAYSSERGWYIELVFAEDARMIRSQFRDLVLPPEEDCRERSL